MGRTRTEGPQRARLAKIQPPRHTALLPRERLYGILDRNRERSATWVVGPPGAGKTTLIAGYLAARELNCLWYQIDEGDVDPATFFHYLATAAGHATAGASDRLPRFSPEAIPGLRGFARGFFRQLFASIPDIVLVIDNYQDAPASCLVHDIASTACDEVPAGSHVVIVSRGDPPPEYARLHANGALGAIRWNELQLTVGEVAGIARLHGLALSSENASEWHRRSGAWAAGLRLLIEQTRGNSATPPGTRPGGPLFDYFAQEVYRWLSPRKQHLLLATSIVPAVSPEIARSLADDAGAGNELEDLTSSGYFTTRHGGTPCLYQYHPLFRDFLLRQAATTLDAQALSQLKLRGASLLAAEGHLEDAAALHAGLGAWDGLQELIMAHAEKLIAQGRHLTLESWLRRLPEGLRRSDPWLEYWLGACLLLHDPAAGRECFARAYDGFIARGDSMDGMLLAWSGAVDAIFHQYDEVAQIDGWLARFDERLRGMFESGSVAAQARVSFSMFVALSFRQPAHSEIDEWARRVSALERQTDDPALRALIRLHVSIDRLWRGQLDEAVALFDSFRRHPDAAASGSPLAPLVESLVDAVLALHLGDSTRCFRAAERGLAIARESGLHFWDTTLIWVAACAAFNVEDFGHAKRLRDALDAIVDLRRAMDAASHHGIAARWCALHGDHPAAMQHASAAMESIRRLGLPFFIGAWALGMACVAQRCGDSACARALLEEGLSIGESLNNDLLRAVGLLLRALERFAAGRHEAALDDLRHAMATCSRRGYAGFYFWPRDVVSLALLRALENGIEPGYAAELVRRTGLSAPGDALGSEVWPWPLKVLCMGRFVLLRDGEPVHAAGKPQRTPLNLLKALIAFGGVGVAESRLIDALWPDSEGDAGEQVLATTLFRLRKLVGADAIERHDGKLTLDAGHCWVDCWCLERVLRASDDAHPKVLREQLERFYSGPFLAAEEDAPWALPLRESLRSRVLSRLRASAQRCEDAHQWDEALTTYRFGMEVDDAVEDFHRGVMRCHIALGQPGDTVAAYRRCRKALASRLGVEPSPATTRLYVDALKRSGG